MKIIDLTHTFTNQMPVYPGDPIPSLKQVANIDSDGFNDHEIHSAMHVGTHMDAPFHMIGDGKKIDEIPPDNLFGKGILIDARDKNQIDESLLASKEIESDAIVLVFTGLGDKFRDPKYFTNSPILTEGFAKWLVDSKVKLLGMDMSSPDKSPFPIHKLLLSNDILIVENLTNLDQLLNVKSFEIIALPAKFQTDGAPVRVIARIED